MMSYTFNKESGAVDAHDKHLQPPDSEELPPVFKEETVEAMKEFGKKYDSGKLDWSLLAFSALEDMVRVMQFGLKKYKERDSWKTVPNGEDRYRRAAVRHALKMSDGEMNDKESGLPHAAHVMVDLMFAEWLRKEGK